MSDTCPDCHSEFRPDGLCPMCDAAPTYIGDDDDDEDGGWCLDKTTSDSLWDTEDDRDQA